MELSPALPAVHHDLARVYLAQQRPQEALAEIEQEPEPVWRLFGQALVYHELGNKKEADAALGEFIAKYSEDAYQVATAYAFRVRPKTPLNGLKKRTSAEIPVFLMLRLILC